jgi:hypothetical protein
MRALVVERLAPDYAGCVVKDVPTPEPGPGQVRIKVRDPVLFAIPRASGWLAQWQEMLQDPEQKIARPRQIYTGADVRDYVPMGKRG